MRILFISLITFSVTLTAFVIQSKGISDLEAFVFSAVVTEADFNLLHQQRHHTVFEGDRHTLIVQSGILKYYKHFPHCMYVIQSIILL